MYYIVLNLKFSDKISRETPPRVLLLGSYIFIKLAPPSRVKADWKFSCPSNIITMYDNESILQG